MPTLPLRVVAQLFNTSAMTSVSLEGLLRVLKQERQLELGHVRSQAGREVARANMRCSDLLKEL